MSNATSFSARADNAFRKSECADTEHLYRKEETPNLQNLIKSKIGLGATSSSNREQLFPGLNIHSLSRKSPHIIEKSRRAPPERQFPEVTGSGLLVMPLPEEKEVNGACLNLFVIPSISIEI